jgi:hypothetical protein
LNSVSAARRTKPGTRIQVHVALPDSEAHYLDEAREIITTSLARLAILARATANS